MMMKFQGNLPTENFFTRWLRDQLREKGWNQADLARASHLDSAVITNIIRGKRGPGLTTCTAIAGALKISPDVVFETAGLMKHREGISDAYISEINSIYDKFNKDNKREAIEFFRLLLRLQDEQDGAHVKQDTLSSK